MISKLQLQNFAAFRKLELNFSPKLNVIIGENNCGKTQLLKTVYAHSKPCNDINQQLLSLFKPRGDLISGLYFNKGEGDARIVVQDAMGREVITEFAAKTRKLVAASNTQPDGNAIFIPTKEVLSLLPAIYNRQVNEDGLSALFDATVIDICKLLLKEPENDLEARVNEDPRLAAIVPMLVDAIEGKYVIEGTEQYFVNGYYADKSDPGVSRSQYAQQYRDNTNLVFKKYSNAETSVTMTAEGYRKIGLLQRLIENGTLTQGNAGTLLWDEPESNMNPSLMKMLVMCLLELSRNGQQVIIATHNYVLLKWFDLLMDEGQGDHIAYHALYRDEDGVIEKETSSDYRMLGANAIAKTYSELYDAEIDRSLGDAT
ncbi:hypothetical protein BST95_12655 [Halioglobus japonicus]|uniref:DNA replication and repair protein RecF n=1 Tax=Halioglobus japonicus TaxID=930805 RepID=A0AAP8SPT6_9GAMM|nr:AAA family ATPase [Halioglobus japonicus]AQA18965.1 hypothetical protein BST95_12655 [Halioglobus japonicus]PLW88020.1 hypothetical protein C0029_05530 [Halioglobus japonicus]GHD20480.1 hypothetical protein GCM10007052_30160 [Halioglobus japonicus]